MSVFTAILIGLAMGAVFGLALEKSRVFEPGIIIGQMRLRNFLMLKIFLTAVTTGLVVLAFLHGFGFVKLSPKAMLVGADLIGGGLVGSRHRIGRRLPRHRRGTGWRGLRGCPPDSGGRPAGRGGLHLS